MTGDKDQRAGGGTVATAEAPPRGAGLRQVHAQLKDLIVSLRSDQARHAEVRAMTPAPGALGAVTPPPGVDGGAQEAAEGAQRWAEAELRQAREAVERAALERDRLARRIVLLEEENRRLSCELVGVRRELIDLSQS